MNEATLSTSFQGTPFFSLSFSAPTQLPVNRSHIPKALELLPLSQGF